MLLKYVAKKNYHVMRQQEKNYGDKIESDKTLHKNKPSVKQHIEFIECLK